MKLMVVLQTVPGEMATLADNNVVAVDVRLKLVGFAADNSRPSDDSRFLRASRLTLRQKSSRDTRSVPRSDALIGSWGGRGLHSSPSRRETEYSPVCILFKKENEGSSQYHLEDKPCKLPQMTSLIKSTPPARLAASHDKCDTRTWLSGGSRRASRCLPPTSLAGLVS